MPVVSTIEPACIEPHIVETSKKIVPTKNESNIQRLTIEYEYMMSTLERQRVAFCYIRVLL